MTTNTVASTNTEKYTEFCDKLATRMVKVNMKDSPFELNDPVKLGKFMSTKQMIPMWFVENLDNESVADFLRRGKEDFRKYGTCIDSTGSEFDYEMLMELFWLKMKRDYPVFIFLYQYVPASLDISDAIEELFSNPIIETYLEMSM